jgi:hypothetical protein
MIFSDFGILSGKNSIFSARHTQHSMQEKQDTYLKMYSKTCPEIVLDLLMLEREINRNQFNTLNNDSAWNILENAKKNIDDVNKYQKKLMGILLETSVPLSETSTTQCKNLKKFIEEMRLRKTN